MVERGLAASRSRARDAIARGLVLVDGVVVAKAGALVVVGARLDVAPASGLDRVSRGALKLEAALDCFGFDPAGRNCLDVGASTGGFCEVLLARGAARVHAVDVGRDQLHPRIAADPRVIAHAPLDARELSPSVIAEPVGAIVADVSFISLAKVLGPALELAAPGCWLAALVKPQFEVGPGNVGRGGIVRDEGLQRQAVDQVARWIAARPGWRVVGDIVSPIAGGSGNREFLLGARHDD